MDKTLVITSAVVFKFEEDISHQNLCSLIECLKLILIYPIFTFTDFSVAVHGLYLDISL